MTKASSSKTAASKKRSAPALTKGQIWKLKDAHIQIVELGRRLVHYKMLRDLGQVRRTQMTSIETMEDYLKKNSARLTRNTGFKKVRPVQAKAA